MKLQKIFSKDKNNIPFFDIITGYLRAENYIVDSIIKIAELKRNENGKVIPLLLPTYRNNDKATLKRKRDIVGYRVVFYGKLFQEENYALIRKHCHSISQTEALKFLTNHSKEIAEVFKEEKVYNEYMLKLIFELGKLPYEFEIMYKGELVNGFSVAKQMWKIDKENFELITYKK